MSTARPLDPFAVPERRAPLSLALATITVAVASSVALVLGGCANPGVPRAQRTVAPVAAPSPEVMPWPAAQWWDRYGDARLEQLVEQAIAGQPGLQAAWLRVEQAQAAVAASDAARQPQLGATADLTDQRFSKHGLVPPALAGAMRWNSNLQLSGSWELDLFGRQRAALDAAIGQWRAAEADAQAARTLLARQVVAGYFGLARLIELRELAVRALVQRRQVLALVQQRIGAGLDTQVERRQAEGLIAQTQVEIEALDEGIARSRHALAELAGQRPDALAALSPRLAAIGTQALPATLPADLLGRRADLVAQRWRVEAAMREVDLARAQFYPNINLMAFVGLSSLGLDRLLRAGSLTYGAGPALRLPVFDGGRLRAQLGGRGAEADAAVEGYNGALLRALREVADEISSLQSLARQAGAQAEAARAADQAHALALQRYEAGLGNFLTVLTAETNVLAQRRAVSELKARQLAAEVALAHALGGGYEADGLPAAAVLGPTAAR